MSNEYGFFASKDGDRKYGAADLCAYFSDIFTDGVLGGNASELRVYPNNKMVLNVSAGTAYIKGRFYRPQTVKTITLSDSDDTNARYDLIVIRLDYTKRSVYLAKIDGIPSAEPAVPDIERNENYYDLCLAKIYVKPAATEITVADITDTRFDTALCGIVTGVVDTIDTSELFAQYQAAWDLLMQSFSGDEQAIINAYDNLNRIRPLEIGSTNLLLNSAFIGTANWGESDTTALSATSGVLKITPSNKAGTDIYTRINRIYGDTTGKYTLSFKAKADAARTVIVALTGYNSNNAAVYTSPYHTLNITTEWQTYTVAFDNTNSDVIRFALSFMSSPANTTPFYLKYPKLERGTETTDWSLSPYDTPAGMQRGTVTLTPSGNKQVPVNVQFAVPYKTAPSIAASSSGYQTGADMTSNSPIIYNKTTTGFTVNSQYANAVTVDWVAVGEYDTTLPTVTITSQPQDMSAANGASATCSVTAEGTNLSYQWLFSADNGATWLTSSCKTAQYTVIAQTQYNGWLYCCRVTNGAGVSVLSDAATLTVTD